MKGVKAAIRVKVGMDARAGHAEVVADRVVRADHTKGRQGLAGGFEVGAAPFYQAKAPAGRSHMGVKRDNESGGVGMSPGARIDGITPDHPAQVQENPFGCRAPGWVRKQVGSPGCRRMRGQSSPG
jgi:hypothetical protein